MSSKSVNEHILELQKELERLKSATTHIEAARDNSNNIINTLQGVQQSYVENSKQIGELFITHANQMTKSGNEQLSALQSSYSKYVDEVKELTKKSIDKSITEISKAEKAIKVAGTSNLDETKKLIQQHDKVVKAGKKFLDDLNAFNIVEWLQKTNNQLIQLQKVISNETLEQQKKLNKAISDINQQTSSVKTSISTNTAELKKIDKSLSDLKNKIGEKSSTNKSSSGFYSEFHSLKSKLDSISSKVSALETNLPIIIVIVALILGVVLFFVLKTK